MKQATTVGLDLAKQILQVHGVNDHGKAVFKKRLSRGKVLEFFATLPACLVGIEACGGSHYWAREIEKFGHVVRQMPPQYVKPYVKTNKNDVNDAEGICEAVGRPSMRFVPTKSIEQQDLQALHRIRERLIGNRTALVNQTRGLLLELGIVVPQGIRILRKALPQLCENLENTLTTLERDYLSNLYTELVEIDEKITIYDNKLKAICDQNEACKRLLKAPGVGVISATAIVAAVGDAKEFKNGRQFSAWLGLVPRQCSSGGKTRLLGISKRGDSYLRRLLMHGARALVRHCQGKEDGRSKWLFSLAYRRGKYKAIAAQANKTARIIWAILAKEEQYKKAA